MAGEDKKYDKRVVVMYDGIHYDSMVECKDGKVKSCGLVSNNTLQLFLVVFNATAYALPTD
jgi:hypothetical protein